MWKKKKNIFCNKVYLFKAKLITYIYVYIYVYVCANNESKEKSEYYLKNVLFFEVNDPPVVRLVGQISNNFSVYICLYAIIVNFRRLWIMHT